jgi:hypothetical protein
MVYRRLSRFKRSHSVPSMHLVERDHRIIRLVHRHRFLRSYQIVAIISGSSRQILRRLQLLYHHGYLERPRAQLDYYHQGGSHQMVYGLGARSAALLKLQHVLRKRTLCTRETGESSHKSESALGGILF